jgi:peptidoglycan hydrolase-like protein with peptidoglycan-binding domain
MNWLALIALAEKYGPVVGALWNLATSNEDYLTKIEAALPQVVKYAVDIATQFFPGAAPQAQVIAGSVLTLNSDFVRYVQRVCNVLVSAGLDVDGMYGPLTGAAVKKLQAKIGITVDGIYGKLTDAKVITLLPKTV